MIDVTLLPGRQVTMADAFQEYSLRRLRDLPLVLGALTSHRTKVNGRPVSRPPISARAVDFGALASRSRNPCGKRQWQLSICGRP